MDLKGYKIIFITVGLIGVLVISSFLFVGVVRLPNNDQFSQLFLLGSKREFGGYPYNVTVNQNYPIYLEVQNHMSSPMDYVLYVKFANSSDPLPNPTAETPSPLEPLYECQFALESGGTWENPLEFSFSGATSENQCVVQRISINGFSYTVDKPAQWNINGSTYDYRLLFELWAYNSQSNSMQYNNRFVYLQLNFTDPL